jgi:hypothetical protein
LSRKGAGQIFANSRPATRNGSHAQKFFSEIQTGGNLWSAPCALIVVERMLRIYFLQQWFNLSDPAVEEALYGSSAMRRFVDIDLGREPVPDETTVCGFRHLLEAHDLGQHCSTKCSGIWRRRN